MYCMYVLDCVFFMQKTAYEMRISDWSSDVCSSDLPPVRPGREGLDPGHRPGAQPDTARRADGRVGGLVHPRFAGADLQLRIARAAARQPRRRVQIARGAEDRKSTRLNSSH